MNKFFVILAVFGIVAGTAIAGSIRGADSDPNTFLAELDQSPFGQTIVSLVSVHLATNGPLDELIVLMNTVRAQLKKDQEADDIQNKTNQANCESTQTSYRKQIKVFKAQKADNTKIRDVNQAALNIAEKDLKETLAGLALNAQRLREGQAERDAQHRDFANQLLERENGVKALDGALQLLQHLQSGTSFVQLKKRFEKVTAELIETSKNSTYGHLYTPLITALADLAEKATPDTIQKIIGLFNELRGQFTKDQQGATVVENKQMASWTSLKSDLETEKDQLSEKRSDLERQIAGYKSLIAEAVKNIQYLAKQIATAKKNLKQSIASCAAQSAGYLSRKAGRKSQGKIISTVVSFFTRRAKGMSEAIKAATARKSL